MGSIPILGIDPSGGQDYFLLTDQSTKILWTKPLPLSLGPLIFGTTPHGFTTSAKRFILEQN
jgi:hypothetical protein